MLFYGALEHQHPIVPEGDVVYLVRTYDLVYVKINQSMGELLIWCIIHLMGV